MKINSIMVRTFFALSALTAAFALSAMNSAVPDNPDFVLAIFATHRARADMLEKAAAQSVLAYNINSESTVDKESKLVKNVWMRSQGKWVHVNEMPLPHVVYDFGTYKKSREKKEAAKVLKAQLRELKIPFINPDEEMHIVNDKMLFAEIMHKNKISHPETMPYGRRNLRKMLDRHDILFIKPTFGSKVFGSITVEKAIKSDKAFYAVTHKIKKRGKWVTVRNDGLTKKHVSNAIKKAKAKLNKTKARYIIQQGVNVHRFNDKQTDFRVNVHRVDRDTVQVSGIFMRVGGNISQGGRAAHYADVLSSLAEKNGVTIESIKAKAEEIALASHSALEKQAGKSIGEIGVDVVVNQLGEVFVIEANNKSGYIRRHLQRNPFVDQLFGLPEFYEQCKNIDNAHEDHIMAYARHLATHSAH